MSILSFLLKPKKEMAKKNTQRVKVGRYTVTRHAQNRIVEESRKINKLDVLDNLSTKHKVIHNNTRNTADIYTAVFLQYYDNSILLFK